MIPQHRSGFEPPLGHTLGPTAPDPSNGQSTGDHLWIENFTGYKKLYTHQTPSHLHPTHKVVATYFPIGFTTSPACSTRTKRRTTKPTTPSDRACGNVQKCSLGRLSNQLPSPSRLDFINLRGRPPPPPTHIFHTV